MIRGQLCAVLFVCLVGTLASPVKAAGFDEQAMHKAIALVDEIADLNVWFHFCARIDSAHVRACDILYQKHQDKYNDCFVNTCGDRPKLQACWNDCADRLAPFKKGSEQCRQAYKKADQEEKKVIDGGSNKLQILPGEYFVRLGATSEQDLSLMYRGIEQESLVRAENKEKTLKVEQTEIHIFDSRVFCGGSDYFNERVARAKEIRAEIKRVLAGQ